MQPCTLPSRFSSHIYEADTCFWRARRLEPGYKITMPIFDYKCRGCGHEFELIVLRTTVVACPACEGRELEQLVSGFAVSTESIRESHLQAARRKLKSSSNYRDQKVAEAEEIREHAPHLVKPAK